MFIFFTIRETCQNPVSDHRLLLSFITFFFILLLSCLNLFSLSGRLIKLFFALIFFPYLFWLIISPLFPFYREHTRACTGWEISTIFISWRNIPEKYRTFKRRDSHLDATSKTTNLYNHRNVFLLLFKLNFCNQLRFFSGSTTSGLPYRNSKISLVKFSHWLSHNNA